MRIVVIGLGGIGRYHLLGLAKAGQADWELQAVDRAQQPRAEAAALLARLGATSPVTYLDDIGRSWKNSDLTVVATQAAGRPALVEALLAHGHRTLVVEKLVCQREADYDRLLSAAAAAKARVWVVAPLRYNAFYDRVDQLIHGDLMALQVAGADLGLATNAIHFADLFARLRGGWDVRFDVGLVAPDILANKRGTDLVEFGGTLAGRDGSGSLLSISNLPFGQATQNISIVSEKLWCMVDVPGGQAHMALRDDGWRMQTAPYVESYVSGVTPQAARDILGTGRCRFPSLLDMRPVHGELFRAFRDQLGRVRGTAPELLPIT